MSTDFDFQCEIVEHTLAQVVARFGDDVEAITWTIAMIDPFFLIVDRANAPPLSPEDGGFLSADNDAKTEATVEGARADFAGMGAAQSWGLATASWGLACRWSEAVRSEAVASVGENALDAHAWLLAFAIASAAQGMSIASLVNPSPLSLVPGFEKDDAALGGVRRDDTLKLAAFGLTRVTRHPLILPVVPWGLANAALAGFHTSDVALFIGLAAYALAGCYAQDLRVEASNQVGTVFNNDALTDFYASTSFVPFGAIADGRQSFEQARREVPWAGLAVGLLLGGAIEWAMLEWIGIDPPL